MNITEAIRILNEAKDQGTQHIIFAFWESNMFDRPDDYAWAADAEYVEDNMDWSYAHDRISDHLTNTAHNSLETLNEQTN